MSSADSISQWIEQIKQGSDEAARALWDRYFPDLVDVARRKLQGMPRKMEDEEDVALSALKSFYRATERGRFPDLAGRDSLWQLLSEMTRRKAVDLIRRTLAQKAGAGKVQGESAFGSSVTAGNQGIGQVGSNDPTPELAVMLAEDCRRLLDELQDEQLQAIALAKMEGYTNEEIAATLDIALRTVERRLGLIRKKWERESS